MKSGLAVGDLPEHGPVTVDVPVPMVALAIGAHPDDVEFGCGATLAKWASVGCRIHFLVLTDGSKGTWSSGEDTEALVATRRREQMDAAKIIGEGTVDFLDLPDGQLDCGLEQRRQVCEAIRRVKPDVVLGHDPWRRYRLHPDHRNAGWLVTDGIVAARDPKFFEDLALEPHRPSVLLLWEPDEPNHVEDVSGFVETKIQALLTHRSQSRSTLGLSADPEEAELASFYEKVALQHEAHGSLAGVAAGEAFRLIDDL
ncbi:MAG TPA: PIG-L family deacetylase [Acidimicrobiales bacterium]|nr:PIG-L family deacetylase [Acidimicrobiales bacterium]